MTNIFTCIARGHGAPVVPATAEDWARARKDPWLEAQCLKIEQLVAAGASDDEIKAEKAKLWVWTPHCAGFRNNHRSVADALVPLNRLMLDFDQKGHTDEIMQRLTALDRPSPLRVLLIEESVRRGTHVLVELPEGMTAEQAQNIMAEATGYEPDKAVKDVSRCIYMVPDSYTRYVDEGLYDGPPLPHALNGSCCDKDKPSCTSPSAEKATNETTLSRSISSHPQGGGTSLAVGNANFKDNNQTLSSGIDDNSGQVSALSLQGRAGRESEPLSYRSLPYSTIISAYWEHTGGEPVEGERNVRLYQLAVQLRAICDNDAELLMQIMPRYRLSDAELRAIVQSATKEPVKGISRLLRSVLDELMSDDELCDNEDLDDLDEDDELNDTDVQINPRTLPIGLRESLSGVPKSMYMPVLCAVLPLAAAYADQVEVEYCDGTLQHLGLMSIIRGEQASGKSVCKNAVDVWKRQFMAEDAIARRREDEWKESRKARKANEKAADDPHVLIRMVPVTVSCSTLLKRFKNAHNHTLYSFGEELDTLRKTNGAGSWSSKYDIYRLSFDRGEWGQDYNSDQAESGVVRAAYNWTMLGTNGALRKCFKNDNIENGLSSRMLIAEMPDSQFAKMPKYGHRSADDEARIQEAVTRLRSWSGLIDTPRLRRAIDRWVEQKRVEAARNIDNVMDTYRRRAAVIGFRCAIVHHLLLNEPEQTPKENTSTIRFATLMADYALEQQISAFGESLEQEVVIAHDNSQRYGINQSIFDQLPTAFSFDDLYALKKGFCSENSIRKIISRWNIEGWIEKSDRKHWRKRSGNTSSSNQK